MVSAGLHYGQMVRREIAVTTIKTPEFRAGRHFTEERVTLHAASSSADGSM